MSLIDAVLQLDDYVLADMMRALDDAHLAAIARDRPRSELLDIAVAHEKALEDGDRSAPVAEPEKMRHATADQVLAVMRGATELCLSLEQLRGYVGGIGDPTRGVRSLVRRGKVRVTGRGKAGRYSLVKAESADVEAHGFPWEPDGASK